MRESAAFGKMVAAEMWRRNFQAAQRGALLGDGSAWIWTLQRTYFPTFEPIVGTWVVVQDGPDTFELTAREVTGEERAAWWERSVAAFPPYAEYQTKTDRVIPVFVLEKNG